LHEQLEQRPWRQILANYQRPDPVRSLVEIILSAAPLAMLWGLAWLAADHGLWWIALLLTAPAAGFMVRLFMVQHDCGHRAFFKSAALNDWVGRIIGVLTLTPYDYWRRAHALHHATSGDLDRRGLGGVATLTVEEYLALPAWRKLAYRLYRHPLVMFGLGPAYVFFLQHRLPFGLMREGWRPWLSAMGTNVAIALFAGAIIWLAGLNSLLLVHLPTMLLAASIGVWLFYVQHQFERTYWRRRGEWDYTEAALHGSSHYDLPRILRWMTANIGVHHVHHASSRIPFYRLQTVLREHPDLKTVSRLSLMGSFRCIGLLLWDERSQRLISLQQLQAQVAGRSSSSR
jgi:omega-6 fatty acid desaturase (delta-12 desaturase)